MTSKNKNELSLLPVFTLVLWLVCLGVGLSGLLMPNSHPVPPTQPTEILDVEITNDISPPETGQQSMSPVPPDLPQPFAIAKPTPAIAFALPTKEPATPKAIAPTQLTLGEGDGRQPAPEYPIEAALARQQGTVVVVFTVDENGRVQSAEATSPSPWPILNQAALRTIRQSWRFPPGKARSYQVAIQFVLNP
jgi:protein TonB